MQEKLESLTLLLDPGEEVWRCTDLGENTSHLTASPFGDSRLIRDLRSLEELLSKPICQMSPVGVSAASQLEALARRVGAYLTDIILSEDTRRAVCLHLDRVPRSTAPLRINIRVSTSPLSDSALALPWELLMPQEGRFAVKDEAIDLCRESQADNISSSHPPPPLSVAVLISAPADQAGLDYEAESRRLAQALSSIGHIAHFSELGQVADLVELIERTNASVLHFSGHGSPGSLVFENELGLSDSVRTGELTKIITQKSKGKALPRLVYLASCHGATTLSVSSARLDREEINFAGTMSTAASLHGEGLCAVVGYHGPISDLASTEAESAFYTALAEGLSLLDAARMARRALSRVHASLGARVFFPFGWSQLAVYLRGEDISFGSPSGAQSRRIYPFSLSRSLSETLRLPVLEHGFFGRRVLHHEVRRKLEHGQSPLVLHGLGGIGKTAFAAHLLSTIAEPRSCLVIQAQGASDIDSLRDQAEAHGAAYSYPNWDEELRHLNAVHPGPADALIWTIRAMCRYCGSLVVYIDGFESFQVGPGNKYGQGRKVGDLNPAGQRLWRIIESLSRECTIILSTRYTWSEMPSDSIVRVGRMTHAEIGRMLNAFPALSMQPREEQERIIALCDGRPRFLEYLSGAIRGDRDLSFLTGFAEETLTENLLLERLYGMLSPAAQEHALAVVVLIHPAPMSVIEALGDAVAELVQTGLLTRQAQFEVRQTGDTMRHVKVDRWHMPRSIRDWMSSLSTREKMYNAGVMAAAEYARLSNLSGARWLDQVEAVRLFLVNNDATSAWPLAFEYAAHLERQGRYASALEVLDRFNERHLPNKESVVLSLFQARLRGISRKYAPDTESKLRDALARAHDVSEDLVAVGLHELGSYLAMEDRSAEAQDFLRQALSLRAKISGVRSADYGVSLHRLAEVLVARGELAAAESCISEALSIAESLEGSSTQSYGVSLHSLAQVLLAQGKISQAEECILASIEIDESIYGRHPSTAVSLRVLADIYQGQGRYEDAEMALMEAATLVQKVLGRGHPEHGRTLLRLGILKARQGFSEDAERLILEGVTAFCASDSEMSKETADALEELALVYREQGRYDESEAMLHRVLAQREEHLSDNYLSYASAQISLASIRIRQGRFLEAEALARNALKIEQDTGDRLPKGSTLHVLARILTHRGLYDEAESILRKHPTLNGEQGETEGQAACLYQLSIILYQTDRLDEAEARIRESIRISELCRGDAHSAYGVSISLLAQILVRQGNYDSAEPVIAKAVECIRTTKGAKHPEYALSLLLRSDVLSHRRDFHGASVALHEALKIQVDSLGLSHPETGGTLYRLGKVSFAEGRHSDAEQLLYQSLAIAEKTAGPLSPQYLRALRELATVLIEQKRYTEGAHCLQRSLEIKREVLPNDHLSHTPELEGLVKVAVAQERWSDAESLLHETLECYRRASQVGVRYAEALTALGDCLLMQDRLAEAEKCFRELVGLLEEHLGPMHPTRAQALRRLGIVHIRSDMYAEAESCFRDVVSIHHHANVEPDDPGVLGALSYLAAAVGRQGRSGEAAQILDEAIVIAANLGEEDPILRHLTRLRGEIVVT